MNYTYTAALLSALGASVQAHSWVEQLMVIAANGTLVGQPGFPRGNALRGTAEFSDGAMVNLIPPNSRPVNDIRATDPICKQSQSTPSQTDGSPRLQAAAGANIAIRYQENGHVSLPETQPGKPENRGTVYIYGTTDSQPDDSLLSIHRVWTPDGQGGDKRGVLLSTRNYDDGQCYQVNGQQISQQRQKLFQHTANSVMGADLWCQNDIQIPATAPSGKPYTLYWVWDWPTMPGTPGFPEGKQEIYTTCMDVDVGGADISAVGASSSDNSKAQTGTSVNAAANFIQGQNVGNAAIPAQLSNILNPTAIVGKFIPFAAQSGAPSGTPASSAAAAPTTSGIATTPVQDVPATGSAPVSSSTVTTTSTAPIGTSTLPASQPTSRPQGQRTRTRTRPHVSPMPAASSSAVANQQNSATATATAINAAPTVTVTAGAGATVTQVQTLISTVVQTKLETVTAAAAPTKRAVGPCSRAERVYQLRARNAFHVEAGDVEC